MDEQQVISALASSSNSSSMLSSRKYDVFLSFRGEDTRRNFTSHLYEALIQKKVETYIDSRLEKGDEISPALIKAIEDSHISVIIFSENYASSKWCLGELSKILECKKEKGQIVIPVFYNIDPSHVRKQIGSYELAFAKHEGEPKCNKWKTALTEVANLAGWDSRTYRADPELLKDILGDVLRKLPPRYRNQRKGLVGIEEHCKQIESLLKIGSSEIITLGIWGMGGIGKTTLATALYDKLSYEFERHYFLTIERKNSIKDLYDKLFSKLSGNKNNNFDYSEMSRLRGEKFFIVLDDVATSEQLDKLIREHDFLGPGSRVIVTTRNKQILSPDDEIYEIKELNSHHSLQLFCSTVFGEKQPKDGYQDLSRRVISYCKGIPLALKVLGASLRKRSKEAWECELRKLKQIPNMKIHNVLKLSYDGLDCSEKDIFLDIACFFEGWDRDLVTDILKARGFFATSGVEVLLDKALITISDEHEIQMHDLIREMGREIIRQESIKYHGRRSLLWRDNEVADVLKYNMGTDVVEGISLDLSKLTSDQELSSDFFAKMTNLRIFIIDDTSDEFNGFNVYLPDGLKSLSNKLRFFYWDRFCLESLPYNFCAEQLVVLCMRDSNLKKLWDGVQNLVNLLCFDLSMSRYLIEIPDLSKAEKLKQVCLGYCESLQLHVQSKSLSYLGLDDCSSLKEFLVTSEKMTALDLSHTPSSIGPRMGHLSSLEELDLSGTNVECLAANIKNLSTLRELYFNDCKKLVSLPELPPSLHKVEAVNCTSLETEVTQQLVLQHMLQSRIPYLHKQYLNNPEYHDSKYFREYFMFPGDHVTDECGFRTAESSLTVPYPPISHLYGFIYCIIFSDGQDLDVSDDDGWEDNVSNDDGWEDDVSDDDGWEDNVLIYTYQEGKQVGRDKMLIEYMNFISDHVYFSYVDISQLDRISEVYDRLNNITFIFQFEVNKERIKGCGVFPVYASESGLKLFGSSSKETFEVGVGDGGSNNENQEEWPQQMKIFL